MVNKVLRLTILFFGFVVLLVGTAGCGPEQDVGTDNADYNAQALKSVKQLTEEGLPPVTVSTLSKTSPLSPLTKFKTRVTNVSDALIRTINGTVVMFDSDGNALPDSVSQLGSADIINAGETIELEMFSNSDEAVSGVWIIEKITYEQKSNNRTFMLKWVNPNFTSEIEDVLGENVPEGILSQ